MAYTLVVVDDNPEDIYTIKRILNNERESYQIIGFEDTEKAMHYICGNQADCIIIDYNLPEMNGIEFVQEYQNNCSIISPVIILTGQGNEELAVDAFKQGISDYLVKMHLNYDILTKSIHYAIEKKKNEIKDREYQEFLRILIDTIPEPVFYKNREGKFLGCNKSFGEFIGSDCLEIIGKTVYDILPKELAEVYHWKDQELMEKSGVQVYESKVINKNGEERIVINKNATFIDIKGKVAGFIGTIHDITEMKNKELVLTEKSYIDSLTLVPNRRFFNERIETDWKNCMRSNNPLSLIMIDIDHFKLYNDHYGHQKGDDCLKEVAAALKKVLKRPSDNIARYGGEEFFILLPFTDSNGAIHIAKELQYAVKNLAIPHEISPVHALLTISMGIFTCSSMEKAINNCIKRVDEALYMAKNLGRNRYEVG